MSKRLAWIAIVVLVAYLVFVGGGWSGIYQPALRMASLLLAGLALGIWAFLILRDRTLRPRSVLLPAITASLGSLAISTAFSRFPGISLEYLGYAIVLVALYLLLVQLLRDEFMRQRLVALAGVLFVVVAAAYVVAVVSLWVPWWQALGRVALPPLRPDYESLTFGSPSAVLMATALLAVPVVASVAWTSRRGVAVVAAALVTVAVVALLTGSRAGWLAMASAGSFAGAVVLLRSDGRAFVRTYLARLLGSGMGRLGLAGALLVILALAAALTPAVLRRAAEGGEGNRLTYLGVAIELFTEAPVVGTGPGTWVIQRIRETPAGGFDDYIPHAHNIYAQTLAELGIVGAAAGFVLLVSLAKLLVRAVRSDSPVRRRWAWAILIALVYFGVHHAFDSYVNEPSILFLLAFPIAFLDATDEPATAGSEWRRFRVRRQALNLAAVGVVAVAIGGLALQELPALRSADAVARADGDDWAGADSPARDAATTDPRISAYLFTAGLTAAHSGDHTAAIKYFRTVAEVDGLPEAWLNLGAEVLEVDGSRQDVGLDVARALRLGIQRPSISIPAGDLALRAGHRDLGLYALSAAVARSPSFLADPWWDSNPTVVGLKADVAARASMETPGVAWEIALMTGDSSRAHVLADSSSHGASVHTFIDAWAGDAASATHLVEDCLARPFDRQVVAWCARVAQRQGNQAEAERFRYLAGTVDPGAATSGTELRVLDPSSVSSVDPGLAQFWAPFTYRRFVPKDMLVPSLVHLTRL